MSAVVLLSGGLDSCVLAKWAKGAYGKVYAISFDYGQRHLEEVDRARAIADNLDVELAVVNIRSVGSLLGGSCLTDPSIDVPEGHYADASMRATVVPNRNMIMLAVAGGHAISVGAGDVLFAAHAGDRTIYPDCRPAFVSAMETAFALSHDPPVQVRAPFSGLNKSHIVKMGYDWGAPLALTWSCYHGRSLHCGKCGACVERREAFALAKCDDPTTYAP